MSEELSKSSEQFFKLIIGKIKNFILKNQKKLVIISSCFFIFVIGLLLFNRFYDFTKIKWDKTNGDANLDCTESSTLTLKVLAYDKKGNKIRKINGGFYDSI